jgi:hypothetical protein
MHLPFISLVCFETGYAGIFCMHTLSPIQYSTLFSFYPKFKKIVCVEIFIKITICFNQCFYFDYIFQSSPKLKEVKI